MKKMGETIKIIILAFLLILLICLVFCRNTDMIAQPSAHTQAPEETVHIHVYSQATCVEPEKCDCGATRGEVLEHSFSEATCDEPATCSDCGATRGEVLEHSFSEATCDEPAACSGCGTTQGSALGHDYILGECAVCGDYDPEYCPKLYFTGDMNGMTEKKDIREISFEYRSGEQNISGAAKIKLQGTSSLQYTKKNYTITFYEDTNYSDKMKVDVGWGAQDEYCLKANWIDKTHSRNVVSAKLAGEMQRKYGVMDAAPNNGAIDGFPVEVYINNEFHGLYTMNIPKAAWMFAMDEDNPNHIVVSGGNWNDPVLFKKIPQNLDDWEVEVGAENEETLKKLQRLVAFIKDSSDEEFKENFENYLNLDSVLNYYIMIKYGWLADNMGKNMLLATYDGEVWYASLYDLDTSWGTDWTGKELQPYQEKVLGAGESLLWIKLERAFKDEIAERYHELRSSVLEPEYIKTKFESFYNSIPQEVLDREAAKWEEIPGYPISQILEYVDAVMPILDEMYSE